MICETVKSLLSEFTDDHLDAGSAWQIQSHLVSCADCRRMSRDLAHLRGALAALPTQAPSAQFEASLAQRLAMTRRPLKRQRWQNRLVSALRIRRPLLGPAFALGLALAAAVATTLVPQTFDSGSQPQSATHTTDRSFVADCVAQHRRDAAGEPLADFAAQNLAGHLDNPAPAVSAADTGLL